MRSAWFSTKKSGFKTIRSATTSLLILLVALASSNKLYAGTTSAEATLHIMVNVVNTVHSQPDIPVQQLPARTEAVIYNLAPQPPQNGPQAVAVHTAAASTPPTNARENCGESCKVLQNLTFVSK